MAPALLRARTILETAQMVLPGFAAMAAEALLAEFSNEQTIKPVKSQQYKQKAANRQ